MFKDCTLWPSSPKWIRFFWHTKEEIKTGQIKFFKASQGAHRAKAGPIAVAISGVIATTPIDKASMYVYGTKSKKKYTLSCVKVIILIYSSTSYLLMHHAVYFAIFEYKDFWSRKSKVWLSTSSKENLSEDETFSLSACQMWKERHARGIPTLNETIFIRIANLANFRNDMLPR